MGIPLALLGALFGHLLGEVTNMPEFADPTSFLILAGVLIVVIAVWDIYSYICSRRRQRKLERTVEALPGGIEELKKLHTRQGGFLRGTLTVSKPKRFLDRFRGGTEN